MTSLLSGGCQCGAVRYRVLGTLEGPHLCHCRMCQKASGNYFMPLAGTPAEQLLITRGEPSWFRSSDPVRRGFCAQCGTPLFFETLGSGQIAVTLGSLDDPEAVVPTSQAGVESRVGFHAALAGLPDSVTDRSDLEAGTAGIAQTNRQHPDHDTADWPRKKDMPHE